MEFVRAVFAAALVVLATLPVRAQGAPSPLPAERFLQGAHSIATMQLRTSRQAASRDLRDDIKAYAVAAVTFREEMLRALDAIMKRHSVMAMHLSAEQQAIVDNLAPLDFIGMSRRFLELHLQTFEQELRTYQAQTATDDAELRAFVSTWLPRIQEQARRAEAVYDPIRP